MWRAQRDIFDEVYETNFMVLTQLAANGVFHQIEFRIANLI